MGGPAGQFMQFFDQTRDTNSGESEFDLYHRLRGVASDYADKLRNTLECKASEARATE